MEADKLSISTNKQFIADLMPRHPIYVKLLNPAAQAVIGQPHPSSTAAMNILLREGFRFNNYIDIFDAGPTLEAPRDLINTINTSKIVKIKNTTHDISSDRFLLANTSINYRATIGHVTFNEQQGSCLLSNEVSELLQVNVGDTIRISPLGTQHV
jgi:arginine N-succinyltransferase